MKKFIVLLLGILTVSTYAANKQEMTDSAIKPFVEILSNDALSIVDPSSTVSVLAEGFKWTEGPLWLKSEGYLIFSDIPNNNIMKYDPKNGISVYLEKSGATNLIDGDYGQGSNGLLLDKNGNLVLLQQGDRRLAVMNAPLSNPKNNFNTLAGYYQNKRLNSPNDAVLHSDGSVFFTDPPYGLKSQLSDDRKELAYQGVYRLTAAGDLQLLDNKVNFPNGIALSKDEKTLFVAVSDKAFPHWLAYDLSPQGKVNNKRVFIDASEFIGKTGELGVPDGMAVHSSGNIFATGPGGVWLISPKGDVLAKIRTGRQTANCTLSADEKTLYMTAHDTLMSVKLK